MLNYKMNTIITPEKEYPVICTLNVLEYIQGKYGNITKFEQLVSGILTDKNEDGKVEYKYTPIHVATLLDGITAMINEGIEIKNETLGDYEEELLKIGTKNAARILRDAEISLTDAANIVLNELTECILPKNAKTVQKEQRKKEMQQSTSHGFSLWEKVFSIIRKKK